MALFSWNLRIKITSLVLVLNHTPKDNLEKRFVCQETVLRVRQAFAWPNAENSLVSVKQSDSNILGSMIYNASLILLKLLIFSSVETDLFASHNPISAWRCSTLRVSSAFSESSCLLGTAKIVQFGWITHLKWLELDVRQEV